MLNLGMGGGGALVLPQRGDGTDLDFPGEALPSLRGRWGLGYRKGGGEERGGTGLIYKI